MAKAAGSGQRPPIPNVKNMVNLGYPGYWCSCKTILRNLESLKRFLECDKSASSLYVCRRIILQMSSLHVNNSKIYFGLGTMLAIILT